MEDHNKKCFFLDFYFAVRGFFLFCSPICMCVCEEVYGFPENASSQRKISGCIITRGVMFQEGSFVHDTSQGN